MFIIYRLDYVSVFNLWVWSSAPAPRLRHYKCLDSSVGAHSLQFSLLFPVLFWKCWEEVFVCLLWEKWQILRQTFFVQMKPSASVNEMFVEFFQAVLLLTRVLLQQTECDVKSENERRAGHPLTGTTSGTRTKIYKSPDHRTLILFIPFWSVWRAVWRSAHWALIQRPTMCSTWLHDLCNIAGSIPTTDVKSPSPSFLFSRSLLDEMSLSKLQGHVTGLICNKKQSRIYVGAATWVSAFFPIY